MTDDWLFTNQVNRLWKLLTEGTSYALLQASAIARQLLLDGEPLLHKVNRNRRLDVRFPVGGTGVPVTLDENEVVGHLIIDYLCVDPTELKWLSLKEFLRFPVRYQANTLYTVHDMIDHPANIGGGVHSGRPKGAKEEMLSYENEKFFGEGMQTSAMRQLHVICLSIHWGLRPLLHAIEHPQEPPLDYGTVAQRLYESMTANGYKDRGIPSVRIVRTQGHSPSGNDPRLRWGNESEFKWEPPKGSTNPNAE